MGNSCIIMCRDHPSTNERGVSDIANDTTLPFFPWAQTLRGNRCTCPICMCNCNKLFYADDMQSLGLVLQGNIQPITPMPATETSHFIAQTLMNANQVVRDATYAASRHGTMICSEQQQELYYTGAADWALRMASNLSLSTKNSLGRTFGRDTNVELPSGDSFSVKLVSTNSNAHARNNRISSSSKARPVARGMQDKLNPSYANLSDEFRNAARNPSNLANMMNSFAQSNNGHNNSFAPLSASAVLAPVTQNRHSSALAQKQLQDFGYDDEEALQVAVIQSAHYGGRGKRTTHDDDDDGGGGGKQRAKTTGNEDDDDDGGGGKQRAKTTGNDGVINLSQTSTGSSPEVIKVRKRNIRDYTTNRDDLTPLQRKSAITLHKNLSKPYDQATMNHLASIREEGYDTPHKVQVLRNFTEDDMI